MEAVVPGVAAPLVAEERWAVSLDEAAERLGVGRTLMHAAARRGDFPTIRIGSRRVISVKLVNDWLVNGFDGGTEDK